MRGETYSKSKLIDEAVVLGIFVHTFPVSSSDSIYLSNFYSLFLSNFTPIGLFMLFFRSLAAEWGRYGMRFNAIAPGPIETKV